MKKAAKKLWKLAKPGRESSLFAGVVLSKLGTPGDLDAGLRKAAEVLGITSPKGQVIPASFPANGDVVVRKALCPDLEATLKVERQTAWCVRHDHQCEWLKEQDHEYGMVVCGAPNARSAKWYEMGGDQGKLPKTDWGKLSKILALLGPVAALGYKKWRQKTIHSEMTEVEQEAYSLVKAVLKAEALGFTWDKSLKRFNLVRTNGWVAIQEDGSLIIKLKGRMKKAKHKRRVDELFDLANRVKMMSAPSEGPFR